MTEPLLHEILVVDDDERLRKLLYKFLSENGFKVMTCASADEARHTLDVFQFDLIILDIMMPGESGLELTQSLDGKIKTPILLLTAMGESHHRIDGLEKGAEDYLTKPFEPKELLLRVQKIIKRTTLATRQDTVCRMGNFSFQVDKGFLYEGQTLIKLTDTEAKLLTILFHKKGTPISREDLAKDNMLNINPRSIDVQITRLRKKIEPNPKAPLYIQTVRHEGYVLRPD